MAGRRKMDKGKHGKINRFRLQESKIDGSVSRMPKVDGKPVVSEGCKALDRWEAECRYKGPDSVMRRAKRVSPVGQRDRTGSGAEDELIEALKTLTAVKATAESERDGRLVAQLVEFMDSKIRNPKLARPKSRRTIDTYNRVEKVLRGESAKCVREKCSHFGDLRAGDVNVAQLERIFDKVAEVHGHGTAKQGLMLMTRVGDFLVKSDAWTINLFLGVNLPEAADPKEPEALNLAEARELLARLETSAEPLPPVAGGKRETGRTIAEFAKDVDLVDPIAVALFLGLRRAELLGLLWKDYDRDAKTLTVRHHLIRAGAADGGEVAGGKLSQLVHEEAVKTDDSGRVIALPDEIVRVLDRRRKKFMTGELKLAKGTPDVIFPNVDGKLRDPDNLNAQWRRVRGPMLEGFAVKRPQHFGLHAFRKTAGSILKEKGYTSVQIADILGHAQVSTTENIYFGRGRIHHDAAQGMNDALAGVLA